MARGGGVGGGGNESLVGAYGRVTGEVGPGLVGEVMLTVRGGAEAFLAYPAEPGVRIGVGVQVAVVEHHPPRTLYVAPLFD